MDNNSIFEKKSWVEKLRVFFWLVVIAGLVLVIIIFARGQELVVRSPQLYQAVFLDNGQTYFGRLGKANRDFLSLTDVYYLRGGTVQSAESAEGQIDLVKLGAELHGPRDEMIINKQHVLFYEDIGQDSEVGKLIRAHKAK